MGGFRCGVFRMSDPTRQQIGVVIIGRNEGERLKRCLRSLVDRTGPIVYVDSGSSDGSVAFARSLGVDVVDLDMDKPFTMARGRNVGFARLIECEPKLRYVQFVDGDCEVVEGWIEKARLVLEDRDDVWVVCGRRRERFPEASVYNRLIDIEWDSPLGEVASCGGDALMRIEAIQKTGGFNETMIGGEEPELCVRIRMAGGKILRINEDMTLHDSAITRFGQWWKRARRAGFAYAHGAALQGHTPMRHKVRNVRSVLIWALVFPAIAVIGIVLAIAWSQIAWVIVGGVVAINLFWLARAYGRARMGPLNGREALVSACLAWICKFSEFRGMLDYCFSRLSSRGPRLIEYKSAEPAEAAAQDSR